MGIRLHVGLPKCASTWLQRRVLPTTGIAFGAPDWVRVPEADPVLSAAAHLLSGDAMPPARHRGLLGRLADHDDVVVSSEVMAVGAWRHRDLLPVAGRLDRMRLLCDGADDTSVLVVVRRDGERLLQSLHSEYVELGGTRPFASFRSEVANPELADPAGIARGVGAAFSRTTVLHLEDLIASPATFMRDLGAWLRVAVDPAHAGLREGAALTAPRSRLARTVNLLGPGFGERGILPSRPRWLRTGGSLARTRTLRSLTPGSPLSR